MILFTSQYNVADPDGGFSVENIPCLGLFGLATFTASKRTKEIGIRKVIGATTHDLVF